MGISANSGRISLFSSNISLLKICKSLFVKFKLLDKLTVELTNFQSLKIRVNALWSYSFLDFDSLLFGCPSLVQNLSKSLRRKVQGKWTYNKVTPFHINLAKNLKVLGINQFQLVDIGILIGTDYFPGIKRIGPKKALNLIKKHKQVEKIIREEKNQFDFGKLTPEIIKKVRKIFLFPDVNKSVSNFYWNLPNKPNILSLLCESHHLNKERVSNNVDKLILSYQKCKKYHQTMKKQPSSVQLTLDTMMK